MGLGLLHHFPVNYNSIDKSDISSVLLSFSSSLATICIFLNDESCMVQPTLIDLNPVELIYYPLMISLNKCTGSCDVFQKKQKT